MLWKVGQVRAKPTQKPKPLTKSRVPAWRPPHDSACTTFCASLSADSTQRRSTTHVCEAVGHQLGSVSTDVLAIHHLGLITKESNRRIKIRKHGKQLKITTQNQGTKKERMETA